MIAACDSCQHAARAADAARTAAAREWNRRAFWDDDAPAPPPAPASAIPPPDSYFTLLGLTSTQATDAEIKAAYKLAARTAHPDAGGSRERWDKLAEAYAVLRDPKRRRKYLLGLKLAGQVKAAAEPSLPPGNNSGGSVVDDAWWMLAADWILAAAAAAGATDSAVATGGTAVCFDDPNSEYRDVLLKHLDAVQSAATAPVMQPPVDDGTLPPLTYDTLLKHFAAVQSAAIASPRAAGKRRKGRKHR